MAETQAPSVAAVAPEEVGPSEPTLEILLQDLPKEKLVGERSAIIGLSPIVPAVVQKEIEQIYLNNGATYDPASLVAPLVAQRILDEIELLARMSNPESTFRPDWYDEDSVEDLVTDLLERDEFLEDFETELVEVHGVPEKIGEKILELVSDYVRDSNQAIQEFYAQGEASQEATNL